jgi:cytochrome c oxidase cbb3-type subunit 3
VLLAQLNNPRTGVMPNWNARLDPATIKSLALYVHSLGGGE